SPEIATAFGFSGTISISNVLLATSVGMTIGDLLAGVLSQKLRKRKLPLGMLLVALCVVQGLLASGYATDEASFVALAGIAGLIEHKSLRIGRLATIVCGSNLTDEQMRQWLVA
ncbi:MAG: hypothetical protein EBU76_10995, partial [Gammaproteobacteria bacterium]|nr:hypothetical protein [Gammaproteobacteria bacterium]